MLGIIRRANGATIGAHRTFLNRDGRKAPIQPVRLSLGPIRGGAVRLGWGTDRAAVAACNEGDLVAGNGTRVLAVAEGIEDALAVGVLLEWRVQPWACLSAGGLAAVELPNAIDEVIVVPDRDDAGIAAQARLVARLKARGIECRVLWPRHKDAAEDLAALRGGRG